ncbi:hypothetical protein SRRS_06680 [Sporomusa rhizae]|uniref:iron-containing alcohol dehydrogenase n=1 Tax=Sporomusa rhizae TaxID=357999 RepID=UPI00352B132B
MEAVVTLSKSIGIPQKLTEIGAKEEDLPKLAKIAFNDVCTPGNPRNTSEERNLRNIQEGVLVLKGPTAWKNSC